MERRESDTSSKSLIVIRCARAGLMLSALRSPIQILADEQERERLRRSVVDLTRELVLVRSRGRKLERLILVEVFLQFMLIVLLLLCCFVLFSYMESSRDSLM